MEASQTRASPNPSSDPNRSSINSSHGGSILSSAPVWPTVDGPLGLSEEDSVTYARRFYKFGYALLPFLWAVNCFYFWPVLRHSHSFPRIRRYIVGSAVGFSVFSVLLCSWALTFAVGGENLFGPVWNQLVMYNVADRLGLTDVMVNCHGCGKCDKQSESDNFEKSWDPFRFVQSSLNGERNGHETDR